MTQTASAAAQEPAFTSKHFLVYAEAAASPHQAREVGRLAERALIDVTARLGHAPSQPVVIFAYGRPASFLQEGAPPRAIATVTWPHNVVRIDLWRSQDELSRVIAHEVAHVVVGRALGGVLDQSPLWFNEGVATWVSGPWTPDDAAQAQDLVRGRRAISLDALDSRFAGNDQEARDAYLESAAIIEYMTRIRGRRVLPRLLDEIRRQGDFDLALSRTVGMRQSQLYDRWLRELRGRPAGLRWGRIGFDAAFYAGVALLCVIAVIQLWRRRRRWQEGQHEEPLTAEEIERARALEELYRRSEDEEGQS